MTEMQAKFNLENFFKKNPLFGRPTCWWQNIKISLKDTGCERLDWIQPFGYRGQWCHERVKKRELNVALYKVEHHSGCTCSSLSHVCQVEVS